MSGNELPSAIGKYHITGIFGRGAMGVVYRALDPVLERVVAIKTLPKNLEVASEGLFHEARLAGNLQHPHIITIFDFGTHEGRPYIVMEAIQGKSLAEMLSERSSWAPSEALAVLAQLAHGLDYAHDQGVFHCDLKPSNLMLEKGGHLYILDFGVAHVRTSSYKPGGVHVLGTPSYLAPERIRGEEMDRRSDLFSLAVIAFELLSGVRPWGSDATDTVLAHILSGKRRSISSVLPGTSFLVDEVVERALAREKEARFATACEMVTAFARAYHLPSPFPEKQAAVDDFQAQQRALQLFRERTGSAQVSSDLHQKKTAPLSPPPKPSSFTEAFRRLSSAHFFRPHARASNPLSKDPFLLMKGGLLVGALVVGYLLITNVVGTSRTNPELIPDQSELKPARSLSLHQNNAARPHQVLSNEALRETLTALAADDSRAVELLREACGRSDPSLNQIIFAKRVHDSYLVRMEVVRCAAVSEDLAALSLLEAALQDTDPSVRKEAVVALGDKNNQRTSELLRGRLMNEQDPKIRGAIKFFLNGGTSQKSEQ